MPAFTIGTPIETDANAPTITVDVDPQNPIPKGRHAFELVVVDDDGLRSDPMTVEVVVMDDRRPTAVLNAPPTVRLGQPIPLDGRESRDEAPGKVVKYIWTMVR